jgi:hypothetical protein
LTPRDLGGDSPRLAGPLATTPYAFYVLY